MKKILITISFIFILTAQKTTLGQTYPIADTDFKRCIEQISPDLLNDSGDLIISEAAFLDSLDCSSYTITNIDGIQFFTNLKVIDLHDNNITNSNQLKNLPLIEELYIQENELIELPDFSNSSNLTLVKANNNFITSIPTLPINTKLLSLDLSQNNLSVFSNLSNQSTLEYLNLSRNTNLKEIQSLDGLTNLKSLHCYLCGLDVLPEVSNMDSLEFLNIGYNFFTHLPNLSSNLKLKTVYANDNKLTSFPDMSMLPLLEKVRLYNNYLSFEDFEPLLVNVNYSDIYKIIPQWNFPNPLSSSYFEFDSVSFQTHIAATTTNVQYTWYFNETTLITSKSDFYSIDSIQLNNSGTYSFTITHPSFPNLILYSDTQNVVVSSCLNPVNFNFKIEGASCQRAGNMNITPFNQPQDNITYTLKSTSTDKVLYSSDGQFQNLSNPEYQLYAQVGSRCKKLINDKITVPIDKCKEAFFTPNNDGVDDNYYFDQYGEAKIYNKWGQLIQTLTIPSEWNGELNNSQKITPGYYTIDINDGEEFFHLSVVY